ncbi:MAG: hypothetical protein A2Y21_10375 [Clostridiales bacterium GWC2_40_7]|nr:MAG: hypothetical protein A2Y21_10375 [Clostridiales bacterium GWC2_40_7]
MRVLDITGKIRENMWNYEEPFPRFKLRSLEDIPWVDGKVYCEIFEGLHSQTGTYLETPAHYYGNDNCYLIADIPVEKLMNKSCSVINIDSKLFCNSQDRIPVTAEMLENSPGSRGIAEGEAVLVGTGWGSRWMDQHYLEHSPYFTNEAMQWLISKKPFLLGTDFPRWENLIKPEGFFESFYTADILMLAPCVNLESIIKSKVKLTALPMNIPGTSCVPCRALIVEE